MKCETCGGDITTGAPRSYFGSFVAHRSAEDCVRHIRSLVLVERMSRIDAETKLALAVEKQTVRRARLAADAARVADAVEREARGIKALHTRWYAGTLDASEALNAIEDHARRIVEAIGRGG